MAVGEAPYGRMLRGIREVRLAVLRVEHLPDAAMTTTQTSRGLGLPLWSLAVAALLSVQLSAAWSMGVIADVTASGTSCDRFSGLAR